MSVITERIFLQINFVTESPMCIGNGSDDGLTDKDLMRYKTGEVFIPGSSIAGVLRGQLDPSEQNALLGACENNIGTVSPLTIYDAALHHKEMDVRDRVELTEGKLAAAQGKFDQEIVPIGVCGTLELELTIRANRTNGDDESTAPNKISKKEALKILRRLAISVQQQNIRFGACTQRGFGCVRITEVKLWEFSAQKYEDYLLFLQNPFQTDAQKQWAGSDFDCKDASEEWEAWELPLQLTAGISIRKYLISQKREDFEHIKNRLTADQGEDQCIPLVPGTSWAGAIRHRMNIILMDLGVAENERGRFLQTFFGKVDKKTKSACASSLVVNESQLVGSRDICLTRTKINRFTGGANDKALFTERVTVGGSTSLKIKLRRNLYVDRAVAAKLASTDKAAAKALPLTDENLRKSFKGLLYLVLKDIHHGYLMIGGQTAIGRGQFTCTDAEKINFVDEDACFSALAVLVKALINKSREKDGGAV